MCSDGKPRSRDGYYSFRREMFKQLSQSLIPVCRVRLWLETPDLLEVGLLAGQRRQLDLDHIARQHRGFFLGGYFAGLAVDIAHQ